MAVSLKHQFTSAKSDGGDSTLVQPSNWNAEHTLTLANNRILGRTAGTDGAVEELTATAVREFINAREVLTADRTYYVRTDGSDSNNGLANTAGGAFLTIQKALDTIATLDLRGYTATVQLADGTYTAGLSVAGQIIGGRVVINGNAGTPAAVLLNVTGNAVSISGSAEITVQNFELRATGIGLLSAYPNAKINIGVGMVFGACNFHAYALSGGVITGSSSYTISGNAIYHLLAVLGGLVELSGGTVTLSGTPAFSGAFALASQSAMSVTGVTFSGAATGSRYEASSNGSINVNGAGASYFPGNAAGTVTTGGQYA